MIASQKVVQVKPHRKSYDRKKVNSPRDHGVNKESKPEINTAQQRSTKISNSRYGDRLVQTTTLARKTHNNIVNQENAVSNPVRTKILITTPEDYIGGP